MHCAKVKLLTKREKKSITPVKRKKYSTVSTKHGDTSHKVTTQKLAAETSDKCVKTDCCTFQLEVDHLQSCNLENYAQLGVIESATCILENRTEPSKATDSVMYFSLIHSFNLHETGQEVMDVLPMTPTEGTCRRIIIIDFKYFSTSLC